LRPIGGLCHERADRPAHRRGVRTSRHWRSHESQDEVAGQRRRVWQAVAGGDADLGFGFASNVVTAPGIELAGFFPREIQYSVVIVAGLSSSVPHTEGTKALIQYLLAPDAATVIRSKGLEPASQ